MLFISLKTVLLQTVSEAIKAFYPLLFSFKSQFPIMSYFNWIKVMFVICQWYDRCITQKLHEFPNISSWYSYFNIFLSYCTILHYMQHTHGSPYSSHYKTIHGTYSHCVPYLNYVYVQSTQKCWHNLYSMSSYIPFFFLTNHWKTNC